MCSILLSPSDRWPHSLPNYLGGYCTPYIETLHHIEFILSYPECDVDTNSIPCNIIGPSQYSQWFAARDADPASNICIYWHLIPAELLFIVTTSFKVQICQILIVLSSNFIQTLQASAPRVTTWSFLPSTSSWAQKLRTSTAMEVFCLLPQIQSLLHQHVSSLSLDIYSDILVETFDSDIPSTS